MADIKKIIERVYQDFNPDKISNVPDILEKYQGNEAELLLKLSQKYDVRLENYISIDCLNLVTAILNKYDRENALTAATLVDAYKGREKDLLFSLGKKYNSNFNDLIIAIFVTGSPLTEPVKNITPAVIENITAYSRENQRTEEPSTGRSSKSLIYIIVAIAFIIIVAIILFAGGVFKSGNKTESQAKNPNVAVDEHIENKDLGEDVFAPKIRATIHAYYSDLTAGTFNAANYFADQVERFITMLNTTPQTINSYINTSYYKEFVNGKSEIEDGSFVVTKEAGGRYSAEYIENGSCYRTSLHKYQHTRAHVRVILNPDFKIVFFQQDKLLENEYSTSPPGNVSKSTSQTASNQTEVQNNSGSFYIISAAAVNTESQAKAKSSELRSAGNSTGYLWIPDYASLSGAKLYCVYIGPFSTQNDCEIATENYRKTHPEAYGLLVSQDRMRVQINGIGKVVTTRR